MTIVYSHANPLYEARRMHLPPCDQNHGAYWYSREICERIIPNVRTDRPWVTVNYLGACEHRAIVFVHNNENPRIYDWLGAYDDLVLVCSRDDTAEAVAHLGLTLVLPLSVDVAYVERFRRDKDRDVAFCGRPERRNGFELPDGIDHVEGLPRERFLEEMARYRRVYAVDRCAIEARILGCDILPYDHRRPDPSVWRVLDNLDAARMLQEMLDAIDG